MSASDPHRTFEDLVVMIMLRAAMSDSAYLAMMAARLIELHRVLKPTGLPVSPLCSHSVQLPSKGLLDSIFFGPRDDLHGTRLILILSGATRREPNDGKSISEWVYWPAIPAKALADARLLEELTTGPRRAEYLVRLPGGFLLPAGTVVVHHSSATDEGPFEALATYEVIDNRLGITVIRHFDAEGVERRLPSERLNMGLPDPRAK
jgi:hypothetical protein